MKVDICIRKATQDDTEALSALIFRAMDDGFRDHYSESQIAELKEYFQPPKLREKLLDEAISQYVGELDGSIVGTIGLVVGSPRQAGFKRRNLVRIHHRWRDCQWRVF